MILISWRITIEHVLSRNQLFSKPQSIVWNSASTKVEVQYVLCYTSPFTSWTVIYDYKNKLGGFASEICELILSGSLGWKQVSIMHSEKDWILYWLMLLQWTTGPLNIWFIELGMLDQMDEWHDGWFLYNSKYKSGLQQWVDVIDYVNNKNLSTRNLCVDASYLLLLLFIII